MDHRQGHSDHGGTVIRIELDAAALGRVRFAVSPLYQVVGLLLAMGRQPDAVPRAWSALAADALRRHRLGLLAALAVNASGFTPDFLTPVPAVYGPCVEEELHAVVGTDALRVAAELEVVARGNADSRIPARGSSPLVRAAMERGEEQFAELAARQLHAFWDHVFAPAWSRLRPRLEQDIAHRAQTTARLGLTAAIDTLDPRLRWRETALTLLCPYETHVDAPGVILVPGLFNRVPSPSLDPAWVDPSLARVPVILYPALPPGMGEQTAPPGELIGATRARLLTRLAAPQTTGQLAAAAGLGQSTVSYHLQVLYRAGLVTRVRRNREVYYQAVGR
jgi:DNA-binding transcriptional ArsR family regulator